MDAALFEKISKRIDGYEDEMIEMQKRLISLPAISPQSGGKGEYQKAKYLEPLLHKVFDKVIECHAPHKEAEGGIRPNYACILNGKSSDKTIWIMAHMDVVPEGERKLWDTDPFTAVVKDGKIYGRGSEDNHQAIVSGYFTAKFFRDEKIIPPYNFGFLLVSDEEISSEYGAKYVLANYKKLFGKNDAVIIPDSGNSKGDEILVAEKSKIWFKVTTKGKQSHAAYPKYGLNAHRVAAHIITKMDDLKKIFDEVNPLYAPHDTCSIEPTMKLKNVQTVNTLPGEDIVFYDCRLLPSVDINHFRKEFEKLANTVAEKNGATVSVEMTDLIQSATPTSPDHPIARVVSQAAKRVYGVDAHPAGGSGYTVGQFFRAEGFPCVVYSKLDDVCHSPNEYCNIDNMVGDAKIWCVTMLDYK